jgi:hypothetical protein
MVTGAPGPATVSNDGLMKEASQVVVAGAGLTGPEI